MNKTKLKAIREYLEQNKDPLSPFRLNLHLQEFKTVYGAIEDKIAISDQDSFYLLNDQFSKKIKRITKKSIYMPNISRWYYDILTYCIDEDYLLPINIDLLALSNLQLKFYWEFLGKETTNFYDNKNNILAAKSALGSGYLYTKKK